MTASSSDETNPPHKLLLTNTQVSKIPKAFANGSPTHQLKVWKTQLSKMIQSGGILGELFVGIPYEMLHAGKEALKKGIILAECKHMIQ